VLRRSIDVAQLIGGLLASYAAVWGVRTLGLIDDPPGAMMTPLRGVAIASVLALVPISMWTIRAAGGAIVRFLGERDRVIMARAYYELLVRSRMTHAEVFALEQVQDEQLEERIQRALREAMVELNALELPDTSDEHRNTVHRAVEQFRAIA
jgi:hypothetical protein